MGLKDSNWEGHRGFRWHTAAWGVGVELGITQPLVLALGCVVAVVCNSTNQGFLSLHHGVLRKSLLLLVPMCPMMTSKSHRLFLRESGWSLWLLCAWITPWWRSCLWFQGPGQAYGVRLHRDSSANTCAFFSFPFHTHHPFLNNRLHDTVSYSFPVGITQKEQTPCL